MKPCLIGRKCDVQIILSINSNYISKQSEVFSTLDVPFFQFKHSCYLVGMQMHMLLQHSTCAASDPSAMQIYEHIEEVLERTNCLLSFDVTQIA
jgi:hypothetical protein